MAGVVDSLRRFFTLEEEGFSSEAGDSASFDPAAAREATAAPAASSRGRGTLISLPSPRKEEIVVLEPSSFGDAREIAETLKLKKSILLNMRKTDKELARRIVDFLSGISYAIDGHSQKVAEQIYLFTPGHIEIVMTQGEGLGTASGGGRDDAPLPAADAI